MESHDKEPKCGTIKSFLGSCSAEEKKGHISTSVIDESLQLAESDETACCSTGEPSESLSAVAATENLFIPSEISCSSKEPPLPP
jgi:hypothetical protein